TIFFNSPYQIIHWDIAPDWTGYYVIFTEEFYRQRWHQQRLTQRFSFLLHDYAAPIAVSKDEATNLYKVFTNLYFEHHNRSTHQEEIILHYINILLLKTAKLYYESNGNKKVSTNQRDNDLNIVGQFKTLVEVSFYPNKIYVEQSPHQVQFYADQLNIHPNHLNALVKRITEHSASDYIQNHLLNLAKAKLKNTSLSVKEIAYELYYNYPNHFSSFFKKQTGSSPNAYRKA
ncbi:MAG: helix-turn-helix domain-containing protein, partial [Bacteroidota bacterium]